MPRMLHSHLPNGSLLFSQMKTASQSFWLILPDLQKKDPIFEKRWNTPPKEDHLWHVKSKDHLLREWCWSPFWRNQKTETWSISRTTWEGKNKNKCIKTLKFYAFKVLTYCLKADSWRHQFIWGSRNTAELGSFRALFHGWSRQRAKTNRSSDRYFQLHHNAVWIGKYSDSCACAACLDSSSLCRSSRSSKRNVDSALFGK